MRRAVAIAQAEGEVAPYRKIFLGNSRALDIGKRRRGTMTLDRAENYVRDIPPELWAIESSPDGQEARVYVADDTPSGFMLL